MSVSFQQTYTRVLRAIAEKIPCSVDDLETINYTFARWYETGDEKDKEVIDLWTYYYIRRYFLIKLINRATYDINDIEELVDKVQQNIDATRKHLYRPESYSGWVGVVCLNVYRNYLRKYAAKLSLEEINEPSVSTNAVHRLENEYDQPIVKKALRRAIQRLPAYLKGVGLMRYVDELGYAEMRESTKLPLATLRSYSNKVGNKLRNNRELKEMVE